MLLGKITLNPRMTQPLSQCLINSLLPTAPSCPEYTYNVDLQLNRNFLLTSCPNTVRTWMFSTRLSVNICWQYLVIANLLVEYFISIEHSLTYYYRSIIVASSTVLCTHGNSRYFKSNYRHVLIRMLEHFGWRCHDEASHLLAERLHFLMQHRAWNKCEPNKLLLRRGWDPGLPRNSEDAIAAEGESLSHAVGRASGPSGCWRSKRPDQRWRTSVASAGMSTTPVRWRTPLAQLRDRQFTCP